MLVAVTIIMIENNPATVCLNQPAFLTGWRDDRAENWIHRKFSDRAEYRRISNGRKFSVDSRIKRGLVNPVRNAGQGFRIGIIGSMSIVRQNLVRAGMA
jgi:hypothetical protein